MVQIEDHFRTKRNIDHAKKEVELVAAFDDMGRIFSASQQFPASLKKVDPICTMSPFQPKVKPMCVASTRTEVPGSPPFVPLNVAAKIGFSSRHRSVIGSRNAPTVAANQGS